MPIRFVYFDLGNVLIHFSVHRMLCQLAELAQKSEAEIQELLFDEQRYRGYEVGEKSTEEFLDMICQSLESTPDRDALIHAICDIFWANDPILSIARKLSTTDFPRGILSNTNPLHWRYIEMAFPASGTSSRTTELQVSKCDRSSPSLKSIKLLSTTLSGKFPIFSRTKSS